MLGSSSLTETLTMILALVPALVIAIVFHEVAHGYVAKLLGDPTASQQGRLSLNPIRHVDPVGTLLVPAGMYLLSGAAFGWAKPVPVNARRLRNPRYGMMAVAAAGPASNLLLGAIGAVLLGMLVYLTDMSQTELANSLTVTMLVYFMQINVFLALFNLLPIPPFDGSHILQGLLPREASRIFGNLQQYGMFVIIVIIAASMAFGTGFISSIVLPPVNWMMGHYLALASWVAGG